MRKRWSDFQTHGTAGLVVSFAPPAGAKRWGAHLALPFPVSSDETRAAYAAYGVGRASNWRIWGPRVIWRYVTLMLRGRRLQTPDAHEDLNQLGGDFLIGPSGRLRYAHVCRSPADRPPVADILRALTDS